MKTIGKIFLLLAFGLCAFAQQWELGGIGGVGFLDNVHVSTTSAGSATAGFAPGVAAGTICGAAKTSVPGRIMRKTSNQRCASYSSRRMD